MGKHSNLEEAVGKRSMNPLFETFLSPGQCEEKSPGENSQGRGDMKAIREMCEVESV